MKNMFLVTLLSLGTVCTSVNAITNPAYYTHDNETSGGDKGVIRPKIPPILPTGSK